MKVARNIDMCNGPLAGKILLYTLPLIATGMLQLLYNAADIIVVGQFAGHSALAAVGSTGPLINLIVNVFAGLSVGVMATVARYYGAQDTENLHNSVHTTMLISVIGGIIVGIIGFILAAPLLRLMNTPDDVLNQSTLYVRIYFIGMPANMIYNFGSSILRAVGDTKRPLVFLTVSGIINVVLNLILVIFCHMAVAGVAIATIVSQWVSAVMVVICLLRETSHIRLIPSHLKIHWKQLGEIAIIGLPAGLQGSVFSISNVMIQSSINKFSSIAMAGSSAAGNLEGFVYIAMNAFYQATLAFAGQNLGARKPERISRVLRLCLLMVTATGLIVGALILVFKQPLLSFYSNEPDVINMGALRLNYILPFYFLCGVMEVFSGQLRGIGCSTTPMITSLLGACGMRILWILTIFQWFPTMEVLYLSYPVSWLLTILGHAVCYRIVSPRVFRKLQST